MRNKKASIKLIQYPYIHLSATFLCKLLLAKKIISFIYTSKSNIYISSKKILSWIAASPFKTKTNKNHIVTTVFNHYWNQILHIIYISIVSF